MSAVTVQEVIEFLEQADELINTTWLPIPDMISRIRTHGIAPPEGMALVPIEPTKEMMRAAEEAYMPFGDMGMALICGNLAAAPKQENE